MKRLIIDRFEGNYAICEDEERTMFAIEILELPKGAKEGSVLKISDSGIINIDENEMNNRREKIKKLQEDLWK